MGQQIFCHVVKSLLPQKEVERIADNLNNLKSQHRQTLETNQKYSGFILSAMQSLYTMKERLEGGNCSEFVSKKWSSPSASIALVSHSTSHLNPQRPAAPRTSSTLGFSCYCRRCCSCFVRDLVSSMSESSAGLGLVS